MSKTLNDLIGHYRKEIEKVENDLDVIWKEIIKANKDGGIEKSCQVQDQYSTIIDVLLDRKKAYEGRIEQLSSMVGAVGK